MTNVVNLFSRSRVTIAETESKSASADQVKVAASAAGRDFEAIAKSNAQMQEKLKQERLQANKLVLKSYRIK